MYGLPDDIWRDLVLSVKVHRKKRRLSPLQTARHMKRALHHTNVDTLAGSLGFTDTTTMRKILRLADIPPDVASLVDWGSHRGSVSMSTAAELMRLPSSDLVQGAMRAAARQGITRDEARQIVQIHERSGESLDECTRRALNTRPRVERSELILGSLLSNSAQDAAALLGNDATTQKLKRLLASRFPDVVCRSVRVNGERFSILLDEEEAAKLRSAIREKSVESTITQLIETLKDH